MKTTGLTRKFPSQSSSFGTLYNQEDHIQLDPWGLVSA